MSALTTFPNMSESDWAEFHLYEYTDSEGLLRYGAVDKITFSGDAASPSREYAKGVHTIEALTPRARQHWCACRVGRRRSQVMLGKRKEYRA